MSEVLCPGCFHHCLIPEGKNGLCRARGTRSSKNVCVNYGRITSLAMDPIEKKPLKHFYPGSWILSAGSYGCNLSCPFCQNSMISMADEYSVSYRVISPKELAEIALREEDNLGIAFTYNEPMISWEYLIDTAELLKPHGKKIVLVTNGCVSDDVLDLLLPYVDAMNIDLKGDAAFYQELGGSYEMVKHTIERAIPACHTEITSLIIPGKNDREEWIDQESSWLAGIDPDDSIKGTGEGSTGRTYSDYAGFRNGIPAFLYPGTSVDHADPGSRNCGRMVGHEYGRNPPRNYH